jgi:hypothetical protein
MTLPLPTTLLDVAQRCVWFQPPSETILEPDFLIAHAFTFGTIDDIAVLRAHFTKEDLTTALINAPPGIIDERSWAYWNLVLRDLSPPPPMPTRTFPEEIHS